MSDLDWLEILMRKWKKIAGGLAGFFVGIILVTFGFWKGFFILVCVAAGIFLGWHLDAGDGIEEIKKLFRR